MSHTPLFKNLHMHMPSCKVRLLLVQYSNCSQLPFLVPPNDSHTVFRERESFCFLAQLLKKLINLKE